MPEKVTKNNSPPPGQGIFAPLSTSERAAVQAYFSERQLPAGTDLWQAGDSGDYLACVTSGSIEVKVDTEFPGKQLVMGVFSAGAAIGASCLLDHLPRATAARALEPTTVQVLDRKNFTALTGDHPQIAIKLLKGLLQAEASRLRQAYSRIASVF